MSDPVYHVDGELVPAGAATVSVTDRGFTYGDAAFETLRAYAGTPFEWDAHAARLARTCETLGFGESVPAAADLRRRVEETLAANDLREAYVRLSVTRGVQPGKLTPAAEVDPTIVVVVSELPEGGTDGERVWDDPARLRTVETRQVPDEALPAGAKTHNYLNGILARLELRNTGEDEALLRSTDGYLTEGATSNVFWVADGTVRTPTTALPLLPGVTRAVVLDIARELEIPVETGRYRDIEADEAFVTNSTWELRPVAHIEGTSFDAGPTPGPVTRRLQQRFDARVDELYEQ
jgi:branched-chain amino acid aminotransferase